MQLTIIYVLAFGSWQFIVEDINDPDAVLLGKDFACQDECVAAARRMTGRPHLAITETQEIY